MKILGKVCLFCAGAICQVAMFASNLIAAESSAERAADADWTVSKTEYGYPNLQGNWTNPSQTPLQRPSGLGLQQSYTAEQAQVLIDRALGLDDARLAALDPDRPAPPVGGRIDQQADGNFETMPTEIARVNGEYRTSLIIDPPDGRLPYLTRINDIYAQWRSQGFGEFDGPEMRGALERCLNPGAQLPLVSAFGGEATGNPGGDNPVRNIQIVQNKDYVVILSEYFSLVRIIRLDSEHLEGQGLKWMGDSIAYYEGSALKIHSKNFRPEQSTGFVRSSDALEITETFTLISDNEMLFSYTIKDPNIFSQTFTAEIPLQRMSPDHRLYEYACHEGNYSMTSILRAARLADN